MFLLKPELLATETTTTQHPWARRIKDAFSNKIKYAHNSIRNPQYPQFAKKKAPPVSNRIKFTIIGDRVTKEFIYCTNLVKGLYKYRKMIFEAPVIQGTTTVEWPIVWNDLKVKYGGIAYCLTSSVAVIINNKFLGGDKELKELIESKFSYYLTLDYYKESIAEFANFIRGSGARECMRENDILQVPVGNSYSLIPRHFCGFHTLTPAVRDDISHAITTALQRPFVYMQISTDGKDVGTLIFMLYSDILPYTCANFLRLCKDTKGGYSGTPIHRIVKDGWIQGGGFGLKETDLDCENFIVPHDRRGVLGMANSGLHMECSTQFFVLLQPAPWMAHKFVAFGQLIEGKGTLDKIEAMPTWYEAPTTEIIIYKAGIFNMDCHDIMINKGANGYIDKHIEDLNELGEVFYEKLLENVFLTAQLRELERLKKEQEGEGGEDEGAAGLRETQRFHRRKEDIEKQLQTSKGDQSSRPSTVVSRATGSVVQRPTSASANDNNEFDVETYDPEIEETDYRHQSIHTPSLVVKPKKPFYIPLTDVLYPGEKDSNFDLKRFLQGDYCLESDLTVPAKTFIPLETYQYSSDLFDIEDSDSASVDSGDEREMQKYLKNNMDRLSFAGGVVRNIGKGVTKFNIFEDKRKSELITDDRLRRLRMASMEHKNRDLHDKKVSISLPSEKPTHIQIKRRQTGFARPEDLEKIRVFSKFGDSYDDDDDDEKDDAEDDDGERKVRMAADTSESTPHKVNRRATAFVPTKLYIEDGDDDDNDEPESKQKVRIEATTSEPQQRSNQVQRRPTAFVRPSAIDKDDDDDDDDDESHDRDDDKPDTRQSVLVRLFDEVKGTDEPPTLKDYKPMSENHPKNLLTFSSNYRIKSESENNREQQRYLRHSITVKSDSYEHVLNIQHGKKMARKISSDYVKTIDQIEHRIENSIRSVEFAKTRPAMSVVEYQMKNRKYQEEHKSLMPQLNRGLRLPGDTPLHSQEDMKEKEKDKEQEKEKTHKPQKAHHRHFSKAL